jgi:hypothetical protein
MEKMPVGISIIKWTSIAIASLFEIANILLILVALAIDSDRTGQVDMREEIFSAIFIIFVKNIFSIIIIFVNFIVLSNRFSFTRKISLTYRSIFVILLTMFLLVCQLLQYAR